MYIDAHTHLNTAKLFKDWKKYISEFEEIGGTMLINAGADEEYNINGITIAKEYHGSCIVKATIGFHPYEVVCGNINKDNIEQKMSELKNQYLENKEHIVAIGECGIDTHYEGGIESIPLQQKLLRMHCELAKEFNLPIVIHSREDFDSTIEVLSNYTELKIYIHCRGYGANEIKITQDMFPNLWIGFDGNISYPKAQNIRDSLDAVDLNNLLLETDAPYLTPQVIRGETNYPANVRYIYEFVTEQLSVDKNKLSKIIEKNCKNLYIK